MKGLLTIMKNNLHGIFLLLFVFGMILFGLFGFGYFSVSMSGQTFPKPNYTILPIAIPLTFPYIAFVLYNSFYKKRKHKVKINKILENRNYINIDFGTSIIEIREVNHSENTDLKILKMFLLFPFYNLFNFSENDKKKNNFRTLVRIRYNYEKKNYTKDFFLPLSKANSEICLKLQKNTNLYIDEMNPNESIIDLDFVNDY